MSDTRHPIRHLLFFTTFFSRYLQASIATFDLQMKLTLVAATFTLVLASASQNASLVHSKGLLAQSSNLTCHTNFNTLNPSQQCSLILSCEDELVLGKINFLHLYYCRLHVPTIILLFMTLFVCFVGLGLTASEFLTPNLHFISKFLNLLDNLAGLTLVALGNGSPDILSTYKALMLDQGDLAVSELLGACFFITSVVVGSIAILKPFKLPQKLLLRDQGFFILIFLIILYSLCTSRIGYVSCFLLVGCYLVYVAYVGASYSILRKKWLSQRRDRLMRSHYDTNAVEPEHVTDGMGLVPFSNLPSIEDLNLSSFGDETYQEQLSLELDQARFSMDEDEYLSRSYGARQLIHELLHQRKGQIQLTNERSFGISMQDNTEANNTFEDDSFSSPKLYWQNIFQVDLPDNTIGKIQALVVFPLKVLIRLTVPLSETGDADRVEVDVRMLSSFIVFFNLNMLPHSLKGFFFVSVPVSIIIMGALTRFNYKIVYAIFGFISSVLWISLFATEIINVLKSFSVIFHISEVILGFTIFALGNCVGDFIADFTIAKMGMPLMAFSACFGSPLLALTSLGVSTLVQLFKTGSSAYQINFSASLIILNIGLIVNMLLIYILSRRAGWYMNEKVGMALIANWVFVCGICILIEAI